MFRKRKLKKERTKYRLKIIAFIFLFVFVIILISEFIFLNFSFGRNSLISPLARQAQSKLAFFEKQLDGKKITYSSAEVTSDGSFKVELRDGGEVILSSKKDIGSQLTSLQLILSRLTIEGKKLKNLDFRFNNPVVEF